RASHRRNRTPRGRTRPRPLARRQRPRPSALPAVAGSLAGIASARADRDAGRLAPLRPHLRPGARLRWRRPRHPGPAGRRPRRPPDGGGTESIRGPAPAATGAGLLDSRQMAPGPRRVHRTRLLPGVAIAAGAAALAARFAVAGVSSQYGDHTELL